MTWPLELKGCHPTVTLLFTCIRGLQASNNQERQGWSSALEKTGPIGLACKLLEKPHTGSADPQGRESQEPGLLFDHSSNLPEPGRRQGMARGPHPQRILILPVDWPHPQTGAAIRKADAVFSERPAQYVHLPWWACARSHNKTHLGLL